MRWRSPLLALALGTMSVSSSSCLIVSAAVGSIVAIVRRATGEAKAEVLLERSPEQIYQAIVDIEDEARDVTIEKVNRRKTRLRVTWRSASIRLRIVAWSSRLTELEITAEHGDMHMTNEDLVTSFIVVVCKKLETECTEAPTRRRRRREKAREAPPANAHPTE